MTDETIVNLGFTPEPYPLGTHVCVMFNDELERRSVVYPYVLAGLHEGEDVHYLADATPPELTIRALDEQSTATLTPAQLDRLHVANALDVYCPRGEFVVDDMLERLHQFFEDSRANGASGCRVAGETSWAVSGVSASENLVPYESAINALVRRAPMTLMCQYDTELFDGGTLFEALSVHALMVIHGQVMRNPYFVGPEEYLAALAEPGQRKRSSPEDVLGQLLLVQLVLSGLPDELRMAEFARCALLRVPGVRDAAVVLTTAIIPDDERWEPVRERCHEAAKDPNSLDVSAIRELAGDAVFLMRSTSRLFGVMILDVDDPDVFAPYQDFLFNVANAVATAQDSWRDRAESRAWIERVAILEQRLWRISHELESAGITSQPPRSRDPYSLPGVHELSRRQWAVLNRLLQGERVPHIAEALFISQSSVRNHLSYIFRKLGVHSQEELLNLFRSRSPES